MWASSWQAKALKALTQLTIEKPYLTSDDLQDVMEEAPANVNSWGAAFGAARDMRLIIDSGRMVHSRRDEAKHRKITLWASCYHINPNVPDPDPVQSYIDQQNVPQQQKLI